MKNALLIFMVKIISLRLICHDTIRLDFCWDDIYRSDFNYC